MKALLSKVPYPVLYTFLFCIPVALFSQGKNQIAVRENDGKGKGIPNIEVLIFEKGKPYCSCGLGFCISTAVAKEKTENSGIAKFKKNPSPLKPGTEYVATIHFKCITPQQGCRSNQECGFEIKTSPVFKTDDKGIFDGFSMPK